MAMFSKERPTKKIDFEGGWVELQYLSKGVKDEIANRLSSMFSIADSLKKSDLENTDEIPAAVLGSLGKVNEAEYYKLSNAIKSWSAADVPITEETVKELDDEIFDLISKEVNQMNELNNKDRKN